MGFRCTCGREFRHQGWFTQHLEGMAKKGKGEAHQNAGATGDPPPGGVGRDGPQVLNVKVLVQVNDRVMTLSQFISLVNRITAVRDTLQHLGLD